MEANVRLERAAGKYFIWKNKSRIEVPNGELKTLFNRYKKIPSYLSSAGKNRVWIWGGSGRRAGPVEQNNAPVMVNNSAGGANNEPNNAKAAPYIPNTPNARTKFIKIRNNWGLKTNGYLQKWLGVQHLRTGATPNSIMNSIIRHSNSLNKNVIKSAFSKIRSGEALYSAAPVGSRPPNTRVGEYLRNVAFDEIIRKFTPALRQAHSGSLFEQAAVAVAAKAAGKKVMSFPKTGLAATNNFTPNQNQRKYYEGNRVRQIWSDMTPARKAELENGIFLLKSAFGLGRIKTNETNNKFKKLFYNLVIENAVNNPNKQAQKSYNLPKGGLLKLKGKNANTSLWKGFYEVQPDVLYFVLKGNTLHVHIYEFKIGSGHAQGVPAEYFQLVKAKRTLDLIMNGSMPRGYDYKITIHFFPLKYRLVGEGSPTNFANPKNYPRGDKWRTYYDQITAIDPTYRIDKETEPSDFKEQTGVDIEVVRKVLDAYSMAAEERIRRHLRHRERHGLYAPGNAAGVAAARTALSVSNQPPNIRNALYKIELGGTSGPNYIASLMAVGSKGVDTAQELVAALFYLDAAGFRLRKKTGNNAGSIKPILSELNIPEKGILGSGSTWSGVKKPKENKKHQNTVSMLLTRIEAAKRAPRNGLGRFGKGLLADLANYDLVPPAPVYASNRAQEKRAELRNKAENLITTPQPQFRAVYSKFIKDHIVPAANLGLTEANAKQAFLNVLNSAAKLANGRGNGVSAEAYRTRMNLVNSL